MNFIKRICVLIYVTLILFLSCVCIALLMGWIQVEMLTSAISAVYYDPMLKIIAGTLAGVLLLVNFIFYRLFSVNVHRDKVIAFDNPSGRVSFSLFALEDLIQRVLGQLAEIKEAKTSITASKKGLQIKIKLTLQSEVNIPEVTAKVQDLVKKKVQDTIGIDESLDVTIYVGKILLGPAKRRRDSEGKVDESAPQPNIPFQGYRA